MRIIRSLAFLAVIAILMPSPPQHDSRAHHGAGAATFCPEGSGLCATAAYLADQFQAKALYSAELVLEWAVDATHDPATGTLEASAAAPGGLTASLASAASPPPGRSTLRLDDLIPEWRGPAPRAQEEG